MRRPPRTATLGVVSLLAAALFGGAVALAEAPADYDPRTGPVLGFLSNPSGHASPRGTGEPLTRPPVRVVARWSIVERDPGIYDWNSTRRTIETIHRAGYRVVLALSPMWVPGKSHGQLHNG